MSGHALIVGASKGIGAETAKLGRLKGWKISALSRSGELKADLEKPAQALQAVKKAVAQHGPLDAVILCQRYRGSGDSWAGELAVSLTATKVLLEGLALKFSKDGGAVVIVSSLADRFVAADQSPAYHAAKAALRQMARYYAVALAPRVRVNVVTPGLVLKDEAKEFYAKNPKLVKLFERATPLGRMCRPRDAAEAIWFLCEPKSSFITGQELVVDGGVSLGFQPAVARSVAGL